MPQKNVKRFSLLLNSVSTLYLVKLRSRVL